MECAHICRTNEIALRITIVFFLKKKCFESFFRYYLILMNILAASLTQSIDQFVNPEDYLIEANLYFEILSLTCGTFIFIIGVFRIIIYHRVILRMDLKGKEKFIKQAVNSNRTLQKQIKKVDSFKNNGEMNSFEPFNYKQQKKPFNIDNA